MASSFLFNPLYAIKDARHVENLYTGDVVFQRGVLKTRPVHGLYCRQCALIRKTLEEVFQDFQDTSKSSDDDTNFVNQEYSLSTKAGVNSSQSPPQINHHCCYECGDSLDGIFCQRCTYEKSLRNRDTSLIFFKIVSLLDEFHRFQNHCCGGRHPCGCAQYFSTHPTLLMDFDFIPSNDLGFDLDVSSPSGDRNKIYDPGICIEVESTRLLSTLSPVIDTLLQFSSENKDKVFNHSVLASKEKSSSSLSHRGFKASKLFHQKSPMTALLGLDAQRPDVDHVIQKHRVSVTLKRISITLSAPGIFKSVMGLGWMHRLRGGKSAAKKKKNPEKSAAKAERPRR
ncbi:hypothetical protein Tco_0117870 [Tanacetum coccineum]